MADPEGGEFCAFARDPPARRVHGVVVDCADPQATGPLEGWIVRRGRSETVDGTSSAGASTRSPG